MQTLTDYFGLDKKLFEATGAFDPFLTIDSRLFIDPKLLENTQAPELQDSLQRIIGYFSDVLTVIAGIQKDEDIFWKQADKMLSFPEMKGLSIGYSSSNEGSGMGPELRRALLANIRAVLAAGVNDPRIFELVGVFQENIGPDRISDMVARIMAPDLVEFTQRVCATCGIPMQETKYSKVSEAVLLPINPSSNAPIILVPKDVLSDLPLAEDYFTVDWVASYNDNVRATINDIMGRALSQVTTAERKQALRQVIIKHPDVLLEMLKTYAEAVGKNYDFVNDPAGELVWYKAAKDSAISFPLALVLPPDPSVADVEKIVLKICQHFKLLIEDNQLAKLLYDGKGIPKHESAAQLLFFGIASAYCLANNLDISPESDAGRGPVDFKFSNGERGKVLVETKLSSNTKLQHGYEKQLPAYLEAEKALKGVFLVIDVGGCTQDRWKKFEALHNSIKEPKPRLICVDASIKKSASKTD